MVVIGIESVDKHQFMKRFDVFEYRYTKTAVKVVGEVFVHENLEIEIGIILEA